MALETEHRLSAYQMLRAGFSKIQAISGISFSFFTSTVALYAAKPVGLGLPRGPGEMCLRATDRIPGDGYDTLALIRPRPRFSISYEDWRGSIPSAAMTKSASNSWPSASLTDGTEVS